MSKVILCVNNVRICVVLQIRQLQHDLHTKEALLQIYSQDDDTPSPVLEAAGALHNPLLLNMEMLQNKVKTLELENFKLTVSTRVEMSRTLIFTVIDLSNLWDL